ncbi:hypothetical protein [Polaromonas sp.]|uniref:hypothetical protein n=1 Tax=Polaromonas sp. TaxID=1869339 RepID=UPI0037C74045
MAIGASEGITAFLDILGFADKVLAAKTSSDFDSILNSVKRIQEYFDHATHDNWIVESQKFSSKEILAFSDSIIVHVPLVSDATRLQGTLDPLLSELHDIAFAQARCVIDGIFIRGGVDLGWWYLQDNTLISQSLVRAYKTEGLANVPVIALTEDLAKFLTNHPDQKTYHESISPMHMFRDGVDKDNKPILYLDYISIALDSLTGFRNPEEEAIYRAASPESGERDNIRNAVYKRAITEWLAHHAKTIKAAHLSASETKVRGKYVWLAAYHNEIATEYLGSEAPLCDLFTS